MDFLVVVVKLGACGVGYAVDVAEEDCHGAGRGDVGYKGRRGSAGNRFGSSGNIQVLDDCCEGGLKCGAHVGDQSEEGLGGGVAEVIDMETEFGSRDF